MGILITLRTKYETCYFKEFALGLLKSGVADNGIICSGYFQEGYTSKGTNAKYVSDETDKYGDTLTDCIPHGFNLKIVGIRSWLSEGEIFPTMVKDPTKNWVESFYNFVDRIRNNKQLAANVEAYYDIEGSWHAKVFIIRNGNKPIAGIVGSSNFTKPAFGSGELKYSYTKESDVVIWDSEYEEVVNRILSKLKNGQGVDDGIIVADYDPKKNGGLTELQRLEKIYADIDIEIEKKKYIKF